MAEEIGVAFVRLIPSMRGFAGAAGDAMNGAAGAPARNAGDAAGAGFGTAFKAGLAGVALAAGMALFGGIQEALNQSRITARLGAQLGATSEDAGRYGRVAGDLYSNAVVDSFQDGADAIRAIMGADLVSADATNAELQEVATGVADLANSFEFDLGETATAVGQIIRNGMAPDAESALDLVAAGLAGTDARAGDLFDTFTEYSSILRQVGLDGETAMGLLRQGMEGGTRDTDQIADAIKEFSLRAVTDAQAVQDAFTALGLDGQRLGDDVAAGGDRATGALDQVLDALREMPATTERATAIQDLFGGPGENLGASIFALDVDRAAESLGDMAGAAEGLGNQLRDNAGTRVEQFRRTMQQNFVEFLGSEVIPAAERLKDDLAPVWAAISEGTAQFRDAVGPALAEVRDGLSGLRAGFQGVQTDAESGMSSTQQTVFNAMTQMGSAVSTGTQLIKDAWALFGQDLMAIGGVFWTQMVEEWGGRLRVISGFFSIWAGVFSGDWRRVWDGVKNVFGGVADIIVSRWRAGMSLLRSLTSAGLGLLRSGWNAGWGAVRSAASAAWQRVWGDTRNYATRMARSAGDGVRDVVSYFGGLKSQLTSRLSGAGSWLVGAGRRIIQGLIDGINAKISALTSTISGIAGRVRDFFPFSPAKEGPLRTHPMDQAGANIGSMLAAGIRSSVGDVAAATRLSASAAANLPTGAASYATGPGSAAVGAPVLRVVADGGRASRAVMELIQHSVRTDYAGDPLAALKPPRR